MFIRPVERQDRKQIRHLLEHRGTFNATEIRVAMEVLDDAVRHPEKGDYHAFCAVDDSGTIAGYVCFGPIPMTENCYDLYWIAVSKEASRRGVGGKLIEFMEGFLAEKKARLIYVDTESGAAYEAARSFYEKNGFRMVCELNDFYRKGASKLTFMKEVPQGVVHHAAKKRRSRKNTQGH